MLCGLPGPNPAPPAPAPTGEGLLPPPDPESDIRLPRVSPGLGRRDEADMPGGGRAVVVGGAIRLGPPLDRFIFAIWADIACIPIPPARPGGRPLLDREGRPCKLAGCDCAEPIGGLEPLDAI